MTEGTRRLRVRALVASWFAVLAAVLVALAVVGGVAAYTAHVEPGTQTEQVERTHWRAEGAFHHSAEVTRENPVFPVGSTLSNRSTYYAQLAPVLDGRYVLTYAGADAESATVELDAALVIRSSGDDEVFWSKRTPIEAVSDESVAPGESVALAFSLNASEVADRQAAIRESLGDTRGELSTFVVVNGAVAGSVDGQPAERSFTHRLPISVGDSTYTVGPAEAGSEPMTTTRTVTTPREYGPFWSVGGPLLLLLGVGGLAGLVVGRQRGAFALSAAERDLLEFRAERAEFDEWVVRARLSTAFDDRARADAESLGDVVDFAIDADTGVIEDPDTGLFYAVTEELVVVYEPPELTRAELREDGDTDGPASFLGDGVTLADEAGEEDADEASTTDDPGTESDEAESTGDEDAADGESPPSKQSRED